jgi:hypothetical protein
MLEHSVPIQHGHAGVPAITVMPQTGAQIEGNSVTVVSSLHI